MAFLLRWHFLCWRVDKGLERGFLVDLFCVDDGCDCVDDDDDIDVDSEDENEDDVNEVCEEGSGDGGVTCAIS